MDGRQPLWDSYVPKNDTAKRCFDLLTSGVGLLISSPILAAVAMGICVLDGRPIFFRQWRIGRGGAGFWLYKFRTMHTAPNAEAGRFDAGNVARVTRTGRILRRTKLDELPQLWNVLRGDMSLVGPRPEVERWVGEFPQRWAFVHQVRPGITDPATVMYRNEEDLLRACSNPEEQYRREILPKKLSMYERHIRTQTFWGDIRILLQTLAAIAHFPGLGTTRTSEPPRASKEQT